MGCHDRKYTTQLQFLMDAEDYSASIATERAASRAARYAAGKEATREQTLARELSEVRTKIEEFGVSPFALAAEFPAAIPAGGGVGSLPPAMFGPPPPMPVVPWQAKGATASRAGASPDVLEMLRTNAVRGSAAARGSPVTEEHSTRTSRDRPFSPSPLALSAAGSAFGAAGGSAAQPPTEPANRIPHRRKNWRVKELRVRTYTDILQEQVATSPALSYWAPVGGVKVDSTESPGVEIQGSTRFQVGWAHRQGLRPSMEDRSVVCGCVNGNRNQDLFAVFDGHGSRAEADLASAYLPACVAHELGALGPSVNVRPSSVETMLEKVFAQTSNAMRAQGYGVQTGTTAVVALVLRDRLYVANVGDSNAILSQKDGSARCLTVEHKPNAPDERARVEALDGGVVTSHRNGIHRVQGVLAVSRALGDFHLEPYVISEPALTRVEMGTEAAHYEFLILACDG